jgi:tRNA modification GTPase
MTGELRGGRITGRGEAGIAVFRIRGRAVPDVLRRIFAPRGPAPLEPGGLRIGRILDGGAPLDEAVLRIRRAPDGWEADFATHGSLYVADRVEALLRAEGAAPLAEDEAWDLGGASGVEPGDLLVADARAGLLSASAWQQAAFFLEAQGGGLSRAVHALERSIAAGAPAARLIARLEALEERAAFGLAMSEPPVVVLAGAPNSGKSTLFNALLRESRAIVSPEPGTTRDVVAEAFTCAGFPMRLQDSAGVRASSDPVERLGVERAREAIVAADIVVLLIDPTGDLESQVTFADSIQGRARRIVVSSKADRADAAARASDPRLRALGATAVSGLSGDGIAELESLLVRGSPFGGAAGPRQPAPFLRRHVEHVAECRAALLRGNSAAAAGALARLRRGEAT